MNRFVVILLSTFLSLFSVSSSFFQNDDPDTIFSAGLTAKQDGDISAALEIWEKGIKEIDNPEDIDARIGFAYIETVAEAKISDKYKLAQDMYFWSLSAHPNEQNVSVIENEIIRLSPLISRREGVRLKKEIKKGNLPEKIRSIWNKYDPTPSTDYNERLIEHWERLNYIKKNYSEGRSLEDTIEQDARAEIYMKFGTPHRSRRGILTIDPLQLRSFVSMRLAQADDPTAAINGFAIQAAQNIEQRVRELHQNPHFEVWRYNNDTQYTNRSIYIFGSDNSGRTYHLKRSVDEFIPPQAFSLGSRNRNSVTIDEEQDATVQTISGADRNVSGGEGQLGADITPAVILQLIYYKQLITFDPIFGDSYVELLSDYGDVSTALSSSLASQHRGTNIGEMTRLRSAMPAEKSAYEDAIREITLDIYPYRFLDENNRPITNFFIESKPYEAFAIDYFQNEYFTLGSSESLPYDYKHSLQVFDGDWNLVKRNNFTPPLDIDLQEQDALATSLFSVPFTNRDDNIIITAELSNPDTSSITDTESPFEKSLKGLGSKRLKHSSPLSTDRLEVSDILLGTDKIAEDAGFAYPFVISHNGSIAQGEDLIFYFEVYGLEKGLDQISRFEVNYSVKTDKRFGLFRRNKTSSSLTLNFDTDEKRFKETIEVETSELEPGKYRLVLDFKDQVSGNKKSREVTFEVTSTTAGSEIADN